MPKRHTNPCRPPRELPIPGDFTISHSSVRSEAAFGSWSTLYRLLVRSRDQWEAAMLTSLLPGLRELRTPLVVGWTWLVAFWILLADYLRTTVATPLVGDVV